MHKLLVISVFLLLETTFPGAAGSPKLKVASLSTVLSDIALSVGGDQIDLIQIVKPGIDPHLFEPTPRDVQKIAKSDIVLASGLGFESYLSRLQTAVGKEPTFVIVGNAIHNTISSNTNPETSHNHSHFDSAVDPHWWHSIANMKLATRLIEEALSKADPAAQNVFVKNAALYQQKLDTLANWVGLEVAKLPKNQRKLVTSHDALGYFARDYGFTIYPVQGINTNEEPSSKNIRQLIKIIQDNQIKSIFAENIDNPKLIQAITQETGAHIGDILYVDGLGASEATTYDAMMRHNVKAIVDGLKNSKEQIGKK